MRIPQMLAVISGNAKERISLCFISLVSCAYLFTGRYFRNKARQNDIKEAIVKPIIAWK